MPAMLLVFLTLGLAADEEEEEFAPDASLFFPSLPSEYQEEQKRLSVSHKNSSEVPIVTDMDTKKKKGSRKSKAQLTMKSSRTGKSVQL